MDVFIYLLIDPRTSEPRYVGKTIDPEQRLKDHCKEKGTNHKNHWIASLLRNGLRPILEIVETIRNSDDTDWQAREVYWMEYFFKVGAPLTNLDTGGIDGKRHSEESKRKMSLSRIGWKPSSETVEKMRVAKQLAALSLTPEQRLALGNGMRGKKHTSDTLRKISMAHAGVPKSNEHRLKISAANKGTRPAEHTLRLAALAKQRPEVREKMRISARLRWDRVKLLKAQKTIAI